MARIGSTVTKISLSLWRVPGSGREPSGCTRFWRCYLPLHFVDACVYDSHVREGNEEETKMYMVKDVHDSTIKGNSCVRVV